MVVKRNHLSGTVRKTMQIPVSLAGRQVAVRLSCVVRERRTCTKAVAVRTLNRVSCTCRATLPTGASGQSSGVIKIALIVAIGSRVGANGIVPTVAPSIAEKEDESPENTGRKPTSRANVNDVVLRCAAVAYRAAPDGIISMSGMVRTTELGLVAALSILLLMLR